MRVMWSGWWFHDSEHPNNDDKKAENDTDNDTDNDKW